MAKNLNFYFNDRGSPCARGPRTERVLMNFLEADVQGDDHVCHDLMEDITAVEERDSESREFVGNAHVVRINRDGIEIESLHTDPPEIYHAGLKHFREVLEDWENFILEESDEDI